MEVCSDAVHVVRHGPWASSTDDEAVSFFANGKPLRGYAIRELVDVPWILPRSVSHFRWEKARQLDEAGLRYTVSTIDGNRFVFDVRTGEILQSRRPAFWAGALTASLAVLLAVFGVVRRLTARTNQRAP